MSNHTTDHIIILLATYNGEAFLAEQLDSIFQQSLQNFSLIVRDDKSTDQTLEILKHYQQQEPERLYILTDESGNLGVIQNYHALLSYVAQSSDSKLASTNYIMLSDQDDVWHPHKIALSLKAMQGLEQQQDETKPLLVHSNLQVVDQQLNPVHPCFMTYQNLQPEKRQFKDLLLQNMVTGSTTMFNKQLLQHALPLPCQCMMHDWWLALVASLIGNIAYIDQPLVKYRQHDNNVIGAKGLQSPKPSNSIRDQHIQQLRQQTDYFYEQYQHYLGKKELAYRKALKLVSKHRSLFRKKLYRPLCKLLA